MTSWTRLSITVFLNLIIVDKISGGSSHEPTDNSTFNGSYSKNNAQLRQKLERDPSFPTAPIPVGFLVNFKAKTIKDNSQGLEAVDRFLKVHARFNVIRLFWMYQSDSNFSPVSEFIGVKK